MTNPKDLAKLAAALSGLPILGCRPDSPAERAGVLYGDILLSVNGRTTSDWTAFIEARALDKSKMELEVFRDGAHIRFTVMLEHEPIKPADLLAELIAERLVPLDMTPAPVGKPN